MKNSFRRPWRQNVMTQVELCHGDIDCKWWQRPFTKRQIAATPGEWRGEVGGRGPSQNSVCPAKKYSGVSPVFSCFNFSCLNKDHIKLFVRHQINFTINANTLFWYICYCKIFTSLRWCYIWRQKRQARSQGVGGCDRPFARDALWDALSQANTKIKII